MNTLHIMKQNKIKPIPIELNFYYNTNKRINRLRKQGNLSRLLIIGLIIWNIFLTYKLFVAPVNVPRISEKLNQQIVLEELPNELIGE